MGYFADLLDELMTRSDAPETFVGERISRMLDSLASQREIRFFVDGTRHFGHQASTVALLRRVIDKTRFRGCTRLIYTDSDKVKPGSTASKLALLMVGLDSRSIDAARIAYGTCKDIRFLHWTDRAALPDTVDYGFTAAADDMSINYAEELGVKYFIRLQPYLWDDAESNRADPYYVCSRIEAHDDRYFYPVDENDAFRSLAYKVAPGLGDAVPDDVWAWYGARQRFDADLRTRTNNAKVLHDAQRQNPELLLWPLYGLHHFAERIAEVAFNIVLTAFQVQQVIRRPIVVVVLNRHPTIPHFAHLLQPFARDLAEKNDDLEHLRATLDEKHMAGQAAERIDPTHVDRFVAEIAGRAHTWLEAGSRLTLVPSYDEARATDLDASQRLDSALSRAAGREVIVVSLGPVPFDVYAYLYANCGLPGLFEGQCSSSPMISLGRPFLQVPREGHVILNSYPTTIAGNDYSTIALAANDAALQLRDQRHEMYLRTDHPRDPCDYWTHLQRTAAFILATVDPSSAISRYFSSLGAFYQQDIHDKWMLGLLALAAVSDGKDPWTTVRNPSTAQV